MFDQENKTYETIWRELVDLYPLIDAPETEPETQQLTAAEETR
jgi:flagellar motor switch protein FliM